jgi:hypothetical protein
VLYHPLVQSYCSLAQNLPQSSFALTLAVQVVVQAIVTALVHLVDIHEDLQPKRIVLTRLLIIIVLGRLTRVRTHRHDIIIYLLKALTMESEEPVLEEAPDLPLVHVHVPILPHVSKFPLLYNLPLALLDPRFLCPHQTDVEADLGPLDAMERYLFVRIVIEFLTDQRRYILRIILALARTLLYLYGLHEGAVLGPQSSYTQRRGAQDLRLLFAPNEVVRDHHIGHTHIHVVADQDLQ